VQNFRVGKTIQCCCENIILKELKMKEICRRYIHRVPDDTPVSSSEATFNIHIVYFLYGLENDNYMDWLRNQMDLVSKWSAKFYIVATLPSGHEEKLRETVGQLYPAAEVTVSTLNSFEYPGIRKVWEVAQSSSSTRDLIFYFHSKGITLTKTYAPHAGANYMSLFELPRVLEVFGTFPTVDRAGHFSSTFGWVWYNFWVARGSYLSALEEPAMTTRRHYYEDWLCRVPKIKMDMVDPSFNETYYYKNPWACYSLCSNIPGNIGYAYDPNTDSFQPL